MDNAIKEEWSRVGSKILCSHMFVVAKDLSCGTFDKMKVRLVAGG
jgi:hypothetical protein